MVSEPGHPLIPRRLSPGTAVEQITGGMTGTVASSAAHLPLTGSLAGAT
jgi:hypothetical protein